MVTRYAMPIRMVYESSLPSYAGIGRYRPYIYRCGIGGSSGVEDLHLYELDADDNTYRQNLSGTTWLQQCWQMPEMTVQATGYNLTSSVTGTTVTHQFDLKPWAYAAPLAPIQVYKWVRSGTFSSDIAIFGTPLTNGWGGSGEVSWSGGTPANFSLNVKQIATYLQGRSLPSGHNYCRIILDYIGFNNCRHEYLDSIGQFGFLRNRYLVRTSAAYYTPERLCGTLGKGITLGTMRETYPAAYSRGGYLALHLSLLGFNIATMAAETANAVWWDYLPVCQHDSDNLPTRACMRISIVSGPSSPHTQIT